jgi:tetratricopeptide (TPR) repeat protein
MARLVRPRLFLLLCLLAPAGNAQRYPLVFVHGSIQGEQIELIQHQVETSKKIEQMERFIQRFPTDQAVPHYLEWMQSYYLRAGQADRVLAMGEKLLALHPLDFDAALRCQQAAVLKKDGALMNRWDESVEALAAQIVTAQQPKGLNDEIWKQNVEVAKGMLAEREYKDYKAAFEAPSAKLKAQMFEDFLRKYQKSQYEAQTWPQLMSLYRNAGDNTRATIAAYRVLSRDEDDPDALLLISQILLERRTEHAKAIANANHVLQTVPRRPKPENYTAAEWERRKAHYIGTAHLQIGNAYVNQNNFIQADKFLRASLPFVKGIEGTEAAVVFYLGWANYQMEQYKEAANFFRQCVALAGTGPFGEQALRNLAALKTERRITE